MQHREPGKTNEKPYEELGLEELEKIQEALTQKAFQAICDPDFSYKLARGLPEKEAKRLLQYRVSLWEELVGGRIRPEVLKNAVRNVLKEVRFPPDSRIGKTLLAIGARRDVRGVLFSDEELEMMTEVAYHRFLVRLKEERRKRLKQKASQIIDPRHAAQVIHAATNPEHLARLMAEVVFYGLHDGLRKVAERPPRRDGVRMVDLDISPEKIKNICKDLILEVGQEERRALNISSTLPQAELVEAAEQALKEGRELEVEVRPVPTKAPSL